MATATFRFYAGLNDFLPPERRQRGLARRCDGRPAVKDPIEALGVPHPEVGLVLVNGRPVGFDHPVAAGDRVAVYPEFTTLAPDASARLRPPPPDAFLLDVHLGRLARRLRLLGIDCAYGNDLDDHRIARRAAAEGRVVLTRDRKLLCFGTIIHGAWLRATDPEQQVDEVLARFAPPLRPFSRCIACNGRLVPATATEIAARVPADARAAGTPCSRCHDCGRIYWQGSHHARLQARVRRYLERIPR